MNVISILTSALGMLIFFNCTMRNFSPTIVLKLALCCSVSADESAGSIVFDTLSGRLPKVVTAEKSPYVVVADITVSQGKTVLIEPGVVFLFNNFTGLNVHGTLLSRGASDKPIIYTSINDKQYNPGTSLEAAPYDWNGINVYDDGLGTHFSYCTIFYSVYGINSTTEYFRIGPSIFQNNGRANLTIAGVEHEVGDEPYEYSLEVNQEGGIPLTILRDPNARKRNLSRYTGLGIGVAGLIVGAVLTRSFADSYDRLEALSSSEHANTSNGTAAQGRQAHDESQGDLGFMIGAYLLGVGGEVTFSWSFTF